MKITIIWISSILSTQITQNIWFGKILCKYTSWKQPLHKKWSFQLRKSSMENFILWAVNVNDFKNIRLIHAKRQHPNLKRILTNSLFANKTAGVFKCSDSKCLSCQQFYWKSRILLKNIGKQLFLKTKTTCHSRNLIYIFICPTCKEKYVGETGTGDSKFKDRVRIYR